MKAPKNVLDHIADCTEVCQDEFPGQLRRLAVKGAHGTSATQWLRVEMDDGRVYEISAKRIS